MKFAARYLYLPLLIHSFHLIFFEKGEISMFHVCNLRNSKSLGIKAHLFHLP